MTTSERSRQMLIVETAQMSDEPVFPVKASAFPFGANTPQDAQDSQDSQDSLDSEDSQRNKGTITGSSPVNSHSPLNLALPEYLRQVFEWSELEKEEDTASWHSPLFFFTRLCKAHPSIMDLPDHMAMQAVEKVMRSWDDLPRKGDPWEYYFDPGDADSARIDFMNSWNSIRHIPFQDVLQNALRLAEQKPLKAAHERGNLYDRFISLAGWLQVLMSDKPILLPTRKIAGLLSCDQTTVSRLRRLAIRDGLLTIVKEFSFRSEGKSEATEFRFAVERFLQPRNEP